MSLSDMAAISALILFFVAIISWFWKLISWFRKRHAETEKLANDSKLWANQLLSRSNNPDKRADIHTYIILLSIKYSRNRIKTLIHLIAMGITIHIMTFGLIIVVSLYHKIILGKLFSFLIFMILLHIAVLLSYYMLLWYSSGIRKITKSWETEIIANIETIIEKDLPDTNE